MGREHTDRETAEVALRLSVAVTRFRSRLREEAGMTSSGFTISQLAVLKHILEEGPTTAASVAAAEHVSQQAIAQSVAVLKTAGFVRAERDATDGRKMLIRVTAAGQEWFESLLASREAWLMRAVDAVVGPAERPTLEAAIELLERLAGADLSLEPGVR
jgi:DNA-binding MarR family transcriptional regulator